MTNLITPLTVKTAQLEASTMISAMLDAFATDHSLVPNTDVDESQRELVLLTAIELVVCSLNNAVDEVHNTDWATITMTDTLEGMDAHYA